MKQKLILFVSQPKYIYWIYMLVALVVTLQKFSRDSINNYKIFKYVFYNFRDGKNIYDLYPGLFDDCNHYGPFFSLIIAPFALLPDGFGCVLWNLANTAFLIFAIQQLNFSERKKAFLCWFLLQELITALMYTQFNVALIGLIILSCVYLEKQAFVKASTNLVVGLLVKIYGIVGLAFWPFLAWKNKLKYSLILAITLLVLWALPSLLSSWDFNLQSYLDWQASLSLKNNDNQILGNAQDISVMGVVRRILQDASIPNIYFIAPGLLLFALPYLRFSQYQHLAFRYLILANVLLFLVLFSTGSESPTYVIAVTGVAIWMNLQEKLKAWDWALLGLVMLLTCFGMSDLFPKSFKTNYIQKYSLKAVPCILVWLRICYDLMTKDFAPKANEKHPVYG
jgi:Glycosyltransferase family 87